MALKIKRQFPYTEREFNLRTPLDDKFDVAERALSKATEQVTNIAKSCMFQAAKKVYQAAKLFEKSDPSVAEFTGHLLASIKAEYVDGIYYYAKTFVENNPIERLQQESPEHGLVYACITLVDCALDVNNGKPVDSYRNSVRCRSALRFVGE